MASIGAFLACLDISIFLLCKGVDGKVTILAPQNGPSYAFTFLNDGLEESLNEFHKYKSVFLETGARAGELISSFPVGSLLTSNSGFDFNFDGLGGEDDGGLDLGAPAKDKAAEEDPW